MKKICTLVGLTLLAGCQNSLFVEAETPGQHYYVAPSGSDANPGTRQQPFATPQRAQAAVRSVKKSPTQPITVHFAAGTYSLAAPLIFTPKDSGVAAITYCAAKPGTATFSGGSRITNWQALSNGVWIADVPWLKNAKEPFTQLYVNNVRRPCARTPNQGAYFYTRRLTLEKNTKDTPQCLGFSVNKEDTLSWIGQPNVRISLFHNWVSSYNRVAQWDAKRNRVVLGLKLVAIQYIYSKGEVNELGCIVSNLIKIFSRMTVLDCRVPNCVHGDERQIAEFVDQ